MTKLCEYCEGTGELECQGVGDNMDLYTIPCEKCKGSGIVFDECSEINQKITAYILLGYNSKNSLPLVEAVFSSKEKAENGILEYKFLYPTAQFVIIERVLDAGVGNEDD